MWVFKRPAGPATRIEKAAGGRNGAIADALDALAKRFEGPLADAIESAYARLYRNTDIDALETAIATGDMAGVFEALGLNDPAEYLAEARQGLPQAVVTGAAGEAPRIGPRASLAPLFGARHGSRRGGAPLRRSGVAGHHLRRRYWLRPGHHRPRGPSRDRARRRGDRGRLRRDAARPGQARGGFTKTCPGFTKTGPGFTKCRQRFTTRW